MGNCCGKASGQSDHFATPGRVLGSSSAAAPHDPAAPRTAPVPSNAKGGRSATGSASQSGPAGGRALGGGAGASEDGPRAQAARAAEARMKQASSGTGKLERDLQAQKKQTRTATLEDVSRENRSQRDADAAAEARNWN